MGRLTSSRPARGEHAVRVGGRWPVLRLLVLVVLFSAVLPADPVGSQGGVPGKPQQLQVETILGGLRFLWYPPHHGGSPITGYEVQYLKTGAQGWTEWPHTGTVTEAGLNSLESARYKLRVRAVNGNGSGPWATTRFSYPPGTTPGRPAAPGMPTVTVGDARLTVSWDAVTDDGGAPIIAYLVRYSLDWGTTWVVWRPDGSSSDIKGTSTVITGLAGVTDYMVTVAARNRVNWSIDSLIARSAKPMMQNPPAVNPPPPPQPVVSVATTATTALPPPPPPPPADPPPPPPPPPPVDPPPPPPPLPPPVDPPPPPPPPPVDPPPPPPLPPPQPPTPPPVQPLPPPQPPTGNSPPQSPVEPPPPSPPPPPLERLPPKQPVSGADPPPGQPPGAGSPPPPGPSPPPQSPESPRRPSALPPQAPPRDVPTG